MKIAFVSQWYDSEVGSAAIARDLQKHGHEVEVVTGVPNNLRGMRKARVS